MPLAPGYMALAVDLRRNGRLAPPPPPPPPAVAAAAAAGVILGGGSGGGSGGGGRGGVATLQRTFVGNAVWAVHIGGAAAAGAAGTGVCACGSNAISHQQQRHQGQQPCFVCALRVGAAAVRGTVEELRGSPQGAREVSWAVWFTVVGACSVLAP